MKKLYKIVAGASTPDHRELADWLAKDGQLLIPLVELLEKGERAIDEVIDAGPGDHRGGPAHERRAGGGAKGTGPSRRRPGVVLLARGAGGARGVEGAAVLKELTERDLSELDVLVVYLDGIVFGDYHVLAAVRWMRMAASTCWGSAAGRRRTPRSRQACFEDLVARGLRADRRRLFVIDGAKATPPFSAATRRLRTPRRPRRPWSPTTLRPAAGPERRTAPGPEHHVAVVLDAKVRARTPGAGRPAGHTVGRRGRRSCRRTA